MELTKKQRILNTIDHKELDRPALYDVLHNLKFIEHVYGKSINSRNAEDAVCSTIAKTFDMTRHIAIPYSLDSTTWEDEDGFVYRKSWWTSEILHRPFKTLLEAKELVKKDIFRIREAVENKKFCQQAKYNMQLFEDLYDSPEEMNSEFIRIQDKMDGTVMIAPEQPDGSCYIQTRYNLDTFLYLLNDYPDLTHELLSAHHDYRISIIDSFPGPEVTPIAFTGTMASGPNGLMFSPSFINRELFPNVRKILNRFKERGYKVVYDFEGDNSEVFDSIVEAGPDISTPVEEISGADIREIKKKYPGLVLGFMIDSIDLLTNGSPADVKKKTMETVELAREHGGILIGSSGALHNEIPVENILAMTDTVKNIKF